MVSKRSCPKGMIERKGYTANRRGKKITVGSACIRATSYKGIKRSDQDKAYLNERHKIQKKIERKYGSSRCPPGKMERAGYTRRAYERRPYTRKSGSFVHGTHVKPSEAAPVCINSRGLRGKEGRPGYKIPMVLEKGDLKKFGYGNVRNLSMQDRHTALREAVSNIGNPLSIFRKLIAIGTVNQNTNPRVSKIFRDDAYWLKDTFGLMKTMPIEGRNSGNSRSSSNARSGSKTSKSSTKRSGRESSMSRTAGSKKSKSKSGSKTTKPNTRSKSTTRKISKNIGSKSTGTKRSGSKSTRTKRSGSKSTRTKRSGSKNTRTKKSGSKK
jgi:hypothetical protein